MDMKKATLPKILIVDDERDLVSAVEFRFKSSNYTVMTAANGQEGLAKAATEDPDLIILDIAMPIIDGHEMLKQLRANPKLKGIPVIIWTASCNSQDIAIASSYGVVDLVTKPFNFAELAAKVESALKHS